MLCAKATLAGRGIMNQQAYAALVAKMRAGHSYVLCLKVRTLSNATCACWYSAMLPVVCAIAADQQFCSFFVACLILLPMLYVAFKPCMA